MKGRVMRIALLAILALWGTACGEKASEKVPVPGTEGALKSAAIVRASRRAFDGAPPTIPHDDFGIACTSCHTREGMEVPEVGYAPPSPHEKTTGMSTSSRCRQCHVFMTTEALLVNNKFEGLRQDLRRGKRLSWISPPTIPHKTFMREDCAACHTGRAAREEIRTPHPERVRCTQCHVPVTTYNTFLR